MTLRRKRQRSPERADQPAAVDWSCRWVVKGHPRWQACGPGRKERRLIYVPPFTKGPDDKTLRTPTVVNAWRR